MTEKELLESLELFAHKLKNPVHAAVLNLDVLKVKLKKGSKDAQTLKHLEIVATEVERVRDLVDAYFRYMKMSDKQKAKIDLRSLLS